MSNIILECRQADTNSVDANGFYESYLANEIVIEEGDVLALKSAFIDTKKESNINISEDLNLKMQFLVYYRDWEEDWDGKNLYFNQAGQNIWQISAVTNPHYYNLGSVYNNKRYIPYYAKYTSGNDYTDVLNVQFKAYGQAFGEDSPSTNIVYSYNDPLSGELITIHHTLPESPADTVFTDYINVVAQKGTFQFISPSLHSLQTDYYWNLIGINQSDIDDDNYIFSPYIFTKNILLPKGSYSPTNLSLYISKKMSENNIDGSDYIISQSDSFAKYINLFRPGVDYPVPDISGVIPAEGTYFFSDDMTQMMQFQNSSKSYLMGASQTSLDFDATSNTFSFNYLHTPIYDGNGNISCRIQNIGKLSISGSTPTVTPYYIKTQDAGGIAFTGLSATTVSNGQFFNFWEGMLGFNLSQICVSARPPVTTTGATTYFGLLGSFYSYNLTPDNTTSGYSGIDASIIKTNNQHGDTWSKINYISNPTENDDAYVVQQAAIFSTIQDTTPLIAETPYLELLDNFSHYIIDANLNFMGNFIGKDKFNNIQGTVSKYYQYDNYCVGGAEGQIQYIHRGMPLMLKSIKLRILKSNKKRDPNLGPDNTILFQLIKSNKTKL